MQAGPCGVGMLLLATLAACDSGSDVVGPFSGPIQRFVIDRVDVPRDSSEAGRVAADLDGDAKPDNKFGYVTAVLAGTNDLSPDSADMIASGALASVLEVQADDPNDDTSTGVRYLGADGDDAVVIGGRLAAGTFVSNRTRETSHPGQARVRLPVFVNADPVTLVVDGAELDLSPDGAGGFEGILRGGVAEMTAREAAHAGLVQMFETEPARHLVFLRGVDQDHDDVLSYDELEASVIGLLVSADISLGGGTIKDSVSIAFAFHATPCPEGRCTTVAPTSACRDRVRDGSETDVDCGGACQACAGGLACAVPADCQSAACDSGGCRAPSCTDGLRDGFESDVDCGGSCPACAAGQVCANDTDCASGACSNGVASLGTCD